MPTVTFVTDPLCSWCWGTLPEIQKALAALEGKVRFELLMGGLQVGGHGPINAFHRRQLERLWQEVHETTGQTFSGIIPAAFSYHSEIPCRAVVAVAAAHGHAPWRFFEALQRAFYVRGLDLAQPEVLAAIANEFNMASDALITMLQDPAIISATRAEFARANALAAHALPTVLLDTGDGPRLVAGGYITAQFLVPDLEQRIN
jgi:putative protein-disulfide isomerase